MISTSTFCTPNTVIATQLYDHHCTSFASPHILRIPCSCLLNQFHDPCSRRNAMKHPFHTFQPPRPGSRQRRTAYTSKQAKAQAKAHSAVPRSVAPASIPWTSCPGRGRRPPPCRPLARHTDGMSPSRSEGADG